MTSATLSFVDESQVLAMTQLMHHLLECADPAPTESAAKALHSVGDSTAIKESAVEPLHSAAAESTVEPLQFVAESDAAVDLPTETSCS
jgi:hypothetical protein